MARQLLEGNHKHRLLVDRRVSRLNEFPFSRGAPACMNAAIHSFEQGRHAGRVMASRLSSNMTSRRVAARFGSGKPV